MLRVAGRRLFSVSQRSSTASSFVLSRDHTLSDGADSASAPRSLASTDLFTFNSQYRSFIRAMNPHVDWTRETKFPHAVWAAFRALIALLIPNFDIVDNLWLEPTSWEGIGCTKTTKVKSGGSASGNTGSRSYPEKKLVICFGSHIASQMLLPPGEENYRSSSEITQAQEIATRMVLQYGWGADDSPAEYYATNAVSALSMGNHHEYEMASKVEKVRFSL